MTPRKYAQTFGLMALLITTLLIPILVGQRSAPEPGVDPKPTDTAQVAQGR